MHVGFSDTYWFDTILCVSYINIDFMELLKIFSENISNPEILDELTQIMSKWYIISGAIFFCIIVIVCYIFRSK